MADQAAQCVVVNTIRAATEDYVAARVMLLTLATLAALLALEKTVDSPDSSAGDAAGAPSSVPAQVSSDNAVGAAHAPSSAAGDVIARSCCRVFTALAPLLPLTRQERRLLSAAHAAAIAVER